MAVDGKWNMTMKTPMGEQNGTLDLKTEGDSLSGQMAGATGTVQIENGKVDGDSVSWNAKITTPMPMTLEFQGKVEGDSLTGTVKLGAFGNAPFTGARA